MEQTRNPAGKQIIIRMYQPDMQLLKATARQLHGTPGLRLGMYGQGGEVLVVAAGQGTDPQVSSDIAEDAAAEFEGAMDEETGHWLEAEMQTAPDASKVFDFGERSYLDGRMAGKIANAAVLDDEETQDPLQQAADRSYAAHKCTKCDFGVAITGTAAGSRMVCVAVTYKKIVYVRCIRPDKDAAKTAALSGLDMMRRLTLGLDIPYARTFKAGHEIDWNEPVSDDAVRKGSAKKSALPIVILVVLLLALVGAGYYLIRTFLFNDDAAATPVSGSVSASVQSAPAADAPQSAPVSAVPESAAGQNATGQSTAQNAPASTPAAQGGASIVRPFG